MIIINNNNKSIYIAPILSSAKRFTMQEKDLVKKKKSKNHYIYMYIITKYKKKTKIGHKLV